MFIQPIDTKLPKTICPDCGVLQNVDTVSHDEETDVLAGQRCWYCGTRLIQDDLKVSGYFKLVIAGNSAPSTAAGIAIWEEQFIHDFGAAPINFRFDDAGRCVITLEPLDGDDEMDNCSRRCGGRCGSRGPCREGHVASSQ